ncbi:MAG: ribonuclease P protein component [Candidatus Eremiobacteraeota bacterium]|nr:ribonuclease P protein component [Candidatus Eremiobacteraeota bacterium]MBV8264240.1 ribonuclease P protein component [Candidatus Eremiobacteraeota bacterium]MBV8339931.1 ribonuclease P protein component [Candidatus Eremiobacteraeota bacterium]MBV8461238.1 ribonuclease P protein component [Candidatus Eremiobacteraeota bacterium]MBV8670065.1 ribonuclease P protein component [Candidatus Eremiobacteraeota bacterium]
MRRYASLRGRREFATVVRRGAVTTTRDLVVFALAPPPWAARQRPRALRVDRRTRTRVGIIITKKVGTAVERNRLRRRCKAVLDALPILQTPMWYVVQLRPSAAGASFAQLRDALHAAVRDHGRPAGRRRRSVEPQGT